jgi:hypothetical protein
MKSQRYEQNTKLRTPSGKETALPLPISTTYLYFHLFSFGARTIPTKQDTGQDHTPFSALKEKLVRFNYHTVLRIFALRLLNHTTKPLKTAKQTPEQTSMMKTSQMTKEPLKNNLRNPFQNDLRNPFQNDLNGYADFQPGSNRMLPMFVSI